VLLVLERIGLKVLRDDVEMQLPHARHGMEADSYIELVFGCDSAHRLRNVRPSEW